MATRTVPMRRVVAAAGAVAGGVADTGICDSSRIKGLESTPESPSLPDSSR